MASSPAVPMRVAVFTNQFPSRGITFFWRDMRTLLDAGFDLDVFPFYPLDADLWRYYSSEAGDASSLPREKVHHIGLAQSVRTIRPWPVGKFATYTQDTTAIMGSALRFGPRALAKSAYVFPKAWAWSAVKAGGYDHVLAYWGNYSATCAYIFHRLTNPSVPFSMFLHAGVDLYEDQVFLREKLLYSDNIIVVCEFNREFLQGLYPELYESIAPKIFKHHLGIDLLRFAYQPDGRPPHRILAVGGLEKYKGFEYLLLAAHELSKRGIEYELELIGDGSQARALRSLADNLLPREKVTFRGWLHSSEVRHAMERATLLVHPSNGVGDAVPTVIKEAMAVGAPVVASDLAGIPELLDRGRCGILVPPGDPLRLAEAMERLLKDPTLRERYARAARAYAEETFDLQRNGARLAQLLVTTKRLTVNPVFSQTAALR